jgi:hypothetical protein
MKYSQQGIEKLLAKIWECKYEQDKIFLFIDGVTGMTPDELVKKYRYTMYKKEPGDFLEG